MSPPALFLYFFLGGDTRLGALPCRTWLRCASGTARSELRRTWTGWWAWAAPGGHRDAAFQSVLSIFFILIVIFHVYLLFFIIVFHLSGPSGSAGRVMLSKEDKEAAKMGLSVFTVRAFPVVFNSCGRFNLIPKLNSPF